MTEENSHEAAPPQKEEPTPPPEDVSVPPPPRQVPHHHSKKKKRFRHDIPVAKPLSIGQLAQREKEWKDSFATEKNQTGGKEPLLPAIFTSNRDKAGQREKATKKEMGVSHSLASARQAAQEWKMEKECGGSTPRQQSRVNLQDRDPFVISPSKFTLFEPNNGYPLPSGHKNFVSGPVSHKGDQSLSPRKPNTNKAQREEEE